MTQNSPFIRTPTSSIIVTSSASLRKANRKTLHNLNSEIKETPSKMELKHRRSLNKTPGSCTVQQRVKGKKSAKDIELLALLHTPPIKKVSPNFKAGNQLKLDFNSSSSTPTSILKMKHKKSSLTPKFSSPASTARKSLRDENFHPKLRFDMSLENTDNLSNVSVEEQMEESIVIKDTISLKKTPLDAVTEEVEMEDDKSETNSIDSHYSFSLPSGTFLLY